MRFDKDEFVSKCRAALNEDRPQPVLREIVSEAVRDKAAVIGELGEPNRASLDMLYHGDDLTVINVVWAPYMSVPAHNHTMSAVIGVYAGGEDNIFWRRNGPLIEAAGAEAVREGGVVSLGADIVHSVVNPLGQFSGAIHVYNGDFVAAARLEWDVESLREGPFDVERQRQRFEDANRLLVPADN